MSKIRFLLTEKLQPFNNDLCADEKEMFSKTLTREECLGLWINRQDVSKRPWQNNISSFCVLCDLFVFDRIRNQGWTRDIFARLTTRRAHTFERVFYRCKNIVKSDNL